MKKYLVPVLAFAFVGASIASIAQSAPMDHLTHGVQGMMGMDSADMQTMQKKMSTAKSNQEYQALMTAQQKLMMHKRMTIVE